ncbi:MAG: hypothetical protein ACJ71G_18545 [Nitrososphaeraceae archaeon]
MTKQNNFNGIYTDGNRSINSLHYNTTRPYIRPVITINNDLFKRLAATMAIGICP